MTTEPSEKIINLFRSFFLLLGLYIIFGILVAILEKMIPGLGTSEYQQNSLMQLISNHPVKAIIMVVIFAPVTEELMFRSLLRPSHREFILFLAVWPVFFLVRFVPVDVNWLMKLFFIAVFLFSVAYIGEQLIQERYTQKIRSWLSRNVIVMLILTSVIFGFVHINNYVEEFTVNLALFLLIVPRILAGFMMGWVKIENGGLAWAMALHAMNNGFALMLLLLFRN